MNQDKVQKLEVKASPRFGNIFLSHLAFNSLILVIPGIDAFEGTVYHVSRVRISECACASA